MPLVRRKLPLVHRQTLDIQGQREAQSTKLTIEGPLSWFSTIVYRGSSHRRKSAACPKYDMVWLHRSPIPVGRKGVISSFKLFLTAFPRVEERGMSGGRHPVERRPSVTGQTNLFNIWGAMDRTSAQPQVKASLLRSNSLKIHAQMWSNDLRSRYTDACTVCTDKKENQIFIIYKKIQSGAVAKSYMRRKGFLICEEMRKYFPIYEKAVSHIWLCNCSTLKFLFSFFQCSRRDSMEFIIESVRHNLTILWLIYSTRSRIRNYTLIYSMSSKK